MRPTKKDKESERGTQEERKGWRRREKPESIRSATHRHASSVLVTLLLSTLWRLMVGSPRVCLYVSLSLSLALSLPLFSLSLSLCPTFSLSFARAMGWAFSRSGSRACPKGMKRNLSQLIHKNCSVTLLSIFALLAMCITGVHLPLRTGLHVCVVRPLI